jgi:hypothetical protein
MDGLQVSEGELTDLGFYFGRFHRNDFVIVSN